MKIIKVFVWSIIVTLTFVCAFFIQLIQNPPNLKVAYKNLVNINREVSKPEKEGYGGSMWALRWKENGAEIILATSTMKSFKGKVAFDPMTQTILFLNGDTLNFASFGKVFEITKSIEIPKITWKTNTGFEMMHKYFSVEHIWNRFLLTSFEGDPDNWQRIMMLIDVGSQKLREELESNFDASKSSEFVIGISNDDVVYIAEGRVAESDIFWSGPTLNQVISHPLDNPGNKTVVLDSTTISKNTKAVFMMPEEGSIIAAGEEIVIFTPSTGGVQKISPSQSLGGFHVASVLENNTVCFQKFSGSPPEGTQTTYAVWDRDSNVVEYTEKKCWGEEEKEIRPIEPFDFLSKELPPQLEVVQIR